jgi:hypothetical protein
MLLVAEINQRIECFGGFDDDVPAATAVAAVGTAEFDEFFAVEADAAGAALAAFEVNFRPDREISFLCGPSGH